MDARGKKLTLGEFLWVMRTQKVMNKKIRF